MSPIRLRVDEYLELARAHGHLTYEDQAKAAGLGFGSIWRARNGDPVGGKVINALMATYDVDFGDLFAAGVPDVTPAKVAS